MSCIPRRALLAWTLLVFCVAACPADDLAPAPEGTFSIVVIPDSQAYRGKGTKATPKSTEPLTNAVFANHVKWIVRNLQTQRIAMVSHVGDIVDRNTSEQWALAREILDGLHGRVPYGLAPGNHDVKGSGDSALFQAQFPAARFAQFAWYGGTLPEQPALAAYGNNANSFQLFSAAGMDFVFLHLECNAPDAVLNWAAEVLAKHAPRRALVTTHMGLGPLSKPAHDDDFVAGPKGRMQWAKVHGAQGNTPQQMWDKCFRRQVNLFVIFSGDQSRTQALHQTTPNDAGRPVHEVLSDYMQTVGEGASWLRVCRFVPAENRIDVRTVDSASGRLCEGTKLVPRRAEHQFSLPYAMTVPAQ